MQNPKITLQIELLGGLIDELSYYNSLEQDEFSDLKFEEVLAAVREMREIVLTDIEEYLNVCKTNNEPICLNYIRVKKELERATFEEY